MAPPIVCLTWAEGDDFGIFVKRNEIVRFLNETFDRALDAPEENIIVGAYTAYDCACYLANYPELTNKVFAIYTARVAHCNLVIEKLLDIAEGGLTPQKEYTKLEPLALSYLQWDLDKGNSWRLRYGELDGVPLEHWPKEAKDYAMNDSIASLRVVEKQLDRAAAMGYSLPDAPEQARADFALRLASNWGIRTNANRVRALDILTTAKLEEEKAKLIQQGLYSTYTAKRGKFAGIPVGSKSNTKLKELVIAAYNGNPPRTDPTKSHPDGQISLAKETLEDIEGTCPEIRPWLNFGRYEKTKSTYITKMWEGIRLPLHPRFNVLVNTGRNSSAGPNLHNQPRLAGVRECFESRPGYVFVSSDFNSQEMRTWAQACLTIVGWSNLAERYKANPDFDPHTAMAALSLLRIPEEDALARLAANDEEVEKARQSAKIANFGLPGCMGPDGLVAYARGYGQFWTREYAESIRRGWQEAWPEQKGYFYHVKSIRGIESFHGRVVQLHSGRWRGGVNVTAASNTYFQGLASEASKAALYEVCRRCYSVESSWLYGCRPVVMIHDEILMEAPVEYAHEAAMELVQVMEAEQNKCTPDVPARAGATLMFNWAKKAKTKRDAGGRLIPWDTREAA